MEIIRTNVVPLVNLGFAIDSEAMANVYVLVRHDDGAFVSRGAIVPLCRVNGCADCFDALKWEVADHGSRVREAVAVVQFPEIVGEPYFVPPRQPSAPMAPSGADEVH